MIDHAETVRAVFLADEDPAFTAEHAKLIRAFRVDWIPIESGAPGIDCEYPFGPGVDVITHAMALLGTGDRRHAAQTIAEAGRILPRYLALAKLEPGTYPTPRELWDWRGVRRDGAFQLQAEHITLLKGSCWTVVDQHNIGDVLEMDTFWPMPYIDGKYPYGDRSYFQLDMADLLGEPYSIAPDEYTVEDDDKDERLERLHEELMPALQVFLAHATVPAADARLRSA